MKISTFCGLWFVLFCISFVVCRFSFLFTVRALRLLRTWTGVDSVWGVFRLKTFTVCEPGFVGFMPSVECVERDYWKQGGESVVRAA